MARPAIKPKHAHARLLDEFGRATLMSHFGLSPQRMHAWYVNGVPYTHRAAVAQLATLHGKPVPGDFLAPPVAA